MMVNGVPKLTCETLLMEYAPGPVRVSPLNHFPIVKDLVIDLEDFLGKLQKVRAVDRAQRQFSARARVYPDAGATGQVQAVYPVYQLHVMLCGVPGLRA